MASSIRVKLNSRGMDELLNSGEVRDILWEQGKKVLATAKAGAPEVSGDYKRSLSMDEVTTDRAVVRVGAYVEYGMTVEAKYGILARALGGSSITAKRKYVTKSGKTIMATQAQIDNWTRGGR